MAQKDIEEVLKYYKEFVKLNQKDTKFSEISQLPFDSLSRIQSKITQGINKTFKGEEIEPGNLSEFIQLLQDQTTALSFISRCISEAAFKGKEIYNKLSEPEQSEVRKSFCNTICKQSDKGSGKICKYTGLLSKPREILKGRLCSEFYVPCH